MHGGAARAAAEGKAVGQVEQAQVGTASSFAVSCRTA
jgi:hypothetical protein